MLLGPVRAVQYRTPPVLPYTSFVVFDKHGLILELVPNRDDFHQQGCGRQQLLLRASECASEESVQSCVRGGSSKSTLETARVFSWRTMNDDHAQAQPVTVDIGKEGQAPAHVHAELPSGSGSIPKSRPPDPTAQWRGVLRATMAAQRFKENVKKQNATALQGTSGGHEGSLNDVQPSFSVRDTTSKKMKPQALINNCCVPNFLPCKKYKVEPNSRQQDAEDSDEDRQLKYLMVIQAALVQQLNSFGIVLTLLAAVTAGSILQPPGSFDGDGHMQSQSLVACFLFFSSLSFLLACTGLMAVIVGSTSLFRPWFFPDSPKESQALKNIMDAQAGSSDDVEYDDISTLGGVIFDNILRVRRLRIYLALSLGLCMVAFVCGAFAILGSEKRNLYMAIGSIVGGGDFVLAVETGMTLVGPTRPPNRLHHLCSVQTSQLNAAQTSVRVLNVTNKKKRWWDCSGILRGSASDGSGHSNGDGGGRGDGDGDGCGRGDP